MVKKEIKKDKTCSSCKKTKKIRRFIKRNKYSDTCVSQCKLCQKKYRKLHKERLVNQGKVYEWIRKISLENREKIKELAIKGVSILDIAKKFKVDRKTIYYHIKNCYQVKEPLPKKEEKSIIKGPFKELPEKFTKPPSGKTYKDYLNEEKNKEKKNNCQHDFWTKRCYNCKKIIENEKTKIETQTRCEHESWLKKCSSCDKRI